MIGYTPLSLVWELSGFPNVQRKHWRIFKRIEHDDNLAVKFLAKLLRVLNVKPL